MRRRMVLTAAVHSLLLLGASYGILAQQPSAAPAKAGKAKAKAARPALFFREDWKQVPTNQEHGVNQESLANPNLELKLYGPSATEIQMTGTTGEETNPPHVWTGLCPSACAATLRDKNNFADLTGLGRIKWVTKVSGYHLVRPVVKLADGTMLVGDHTHGSTADWLTDDIAIPDLRWRRLDPERVVTVGEWVANPDLSKVDEIGFADLMPGSGHGQGGWSDVGVIEVYGKPVKR